MKGKLCNRGFWFYVIASAIPMMVTTQFAATNLLPAIILVLAIWFFGGVIYYFAKVSEGCRIIGGCIMAFAIALAPSILRGFGASVSWWAGVLLGCYVFLAFFIASDFMNQSIKANTTDDSEGDDN